MGLILVFTHIVFFRLKDKTQNHREDVRAWFLNMKGQIPDILDVEVGVDVIHSTRSYDIALIGRFSDQAAMERYQVHPVHQSVLARLKDLVESSAAVDFVS